jgi:hypothetical protein
MRIRFWALASSPILIAFTQIRNSDKIKNLITIYCSQEPEPHNVCVPEPQPTWCGSDYGSSTPIFWPILYWKQIYIFFIFFHYIGPKNTSQSQNRTCIIFYEGTASTLCSSDSGSEPLSLAYMVKNQKCSINFWFFHYRYIGQRTGVGVVARLGAGKFVVGTARTWCGSKSGCDTNPLAYCI